MNKHKSSHWSKKLMKMIWSVQNHFGSIEGQGTIQVLLQQRGGWVGSENFNFFYLQYILFILTLVGKPKKTKNKQT